MGWKVYAEQLETTDFSGIPRIYQPVLFDDAYLIKAARVWLVFYGDPTFTSIQLKAYRNANGEPGSLIGTSTNSFALADVMTESYGVKEVWFEFEPFQARNTEYVHFAIHINGYTGTDAAHVAWVRATPDGVYSSDLSLTNLNVHIAPLRITLIGAAF